MSNNKWYDGLIDRVDSIADDINPMIDDIAEEVMPVVDNITEKIISTSEYVTDQAKGYLFDTPYDQDGRLFPTSEDASIQFEHEISTNQQYYLHELIDKKDGTELTMSYAIDRRSRAGDQ